MDEARQGQGRHQVWTDAVCEGVKGLLGRVGGERRAYRPNRTFNCPQRTGLGALAELRGRRVLPLGEAVAPIVLHDVGHVEISPSAMGELPEANGRRIPVSRNPDVDQVPVGEVGPGGHRGHAAVDGIKAVGAGEKIGRGLRRAADARELGYPMGLDVQLEAGVHDGRSSQEQARHSRV